MARGRILSSIFLHIMGLALLGVHFTGCGNGMGPEAVLTPGVTTEADVERTLDKPVQTRPAAGRKDARMKSYKGARCKYQFVNGDVRLDARICDVDPLRGEETLQYWRHRWKKQRTQIERLKDNGSTHGRCSALFRNFDTGQSVLFDVFSGKVSKLVETASRKDRR